jgi:hypothetical protein
MECRSEPLGNFSKQNLPGEARILLQSASGIRYDLGRASTGPLGSPLLRHQAGKAVSLVGGAYMVERRPTDPEPVGHLGNGELVDSTAAQHLVPDLEQVAGIEEGPGVEQLVLDLLGVRMEKATRSQVLGLRVLRWVGRHRGSSRAG